MARPKIVAEKRKILGRKVKKLRREGILPANLFGKKIKSQALQVSQKELLEVFEKMGETGLIDLAVDKQKARPVLISSLQVDPVTGSSLHVDFHQVDLEEKTVVAVPIELIGTSPVIEKDEGVLVQPLLEVEVEALPQQLPDHLEADVSVLTKLNDAVRVSDLKVGKEVEIKAEKNEIVVKVGALREEEVAPVATEEAGVEEKGEGEEGKEIEEKKEEKEEKVETQKSSS
ncbi:50S ribosomal protein L25 [Candidatus Shapirobacteria bacterium CG09_land_8_20_14_0_10_38_17]|uniref:Large ribosomal subunit protein bL25 n=1 Tax=Candidatus Shapirobacteria bacterium CG09_land_8_20_14_0_10_38_17 TaxID=1974884 RepID=A0A2H0WQT5_9BACT|nr:MAG: 50S ribosomal protein L25 [Candidatus Shapirobacteria bacterium CG09_land_8_20_14_0_10_38_17]